MKFLKIYPYQGLYHSNPGKISKIQGFSTKIQGLLYKRLVSMSEHLIKYTGTCLKRTIHVNSQLLINSSYCLLL